MTSLPVYVGAITVAGTAGILTATCAVLYLGGRGSGASRPAAATATAAAATLFGAWAVASAVFAHHGGYRPQLAKQPPWLPLETVAALVALLALTRIPFVSRALTGPDSVRLLSRPHAFRVAGVAFLISMFLGHLPALFALPAGLGDLAIGVAEPLMMRRIRTGIGHRAATWFNLLGLLDLVSAMTLGGLTAYGIVHVSPASSAVGELPLVLIPTVAVPVLLGLHILTLRRLRLGVRWSVGPPPAQYGVRRPSKAWRLSNLYFAHTPGLGRALSGSSSRPGGERN
jgi:hypothetical protein